MEFYKWEVAGNTCLILDIEEFKPYPKNITKLCSIEQGLGSDMVVVVDSMSFEEYNSLNILYKNKN